MCVCVCGEDKAQSPLAQLMIRKIDVSITRAHALWSCKVQRWVFLPLDYRKKGCSALNSSKNRQLGSVLRCVAVCCIVLQFVVACHLDTSLSTTIIDVLGGVCLTSQCRHEVGHEQHTLTHPDACTTTTHWQCYSELLSAGCARLHMQPKGSAPWLT